METEQLESEMRACRKCEGIFSDRFIDPITQTQSLQIKPIFAGASSAQIMLIGQAPGISEYKKGKAFQGQAGGAIRKIFLAVGISSSEFDAHVYQTSITKCFPGRKKVRRKDLKTGSEYFKEEDRVPSLGEISNCIPYLGRQIALVHPKVLVLLGKLAIVGYLRLSGRRLVGGLENYVGKSESWNDISVVFFPHTSGTSRWLNPPRNKELFRDAKALLANEIRRRGIDAYQ